MLKIESPKNSLIKSIVKLQQKKVRDSEKMYIIEGDHLLEEAISNHASIAYCFVDENHVAKYQSLLEKVDDHLVYCVPTSVMERLSTLPSAPSIVAVIKKRPPDFNAELPPLILMLDSVQDPGNFGTLIRTADAAGFTHIYVNDKCVDLYHPKVMRALQGSHYHVEIEVVSLIEKINKLKQVGYKIFGTSLEVNSVDYCMPPSFEKCALIVGNEGQGVSKELLSVTDTNLHITMPGKAESLNVAVAAGIVMFSLIQSRKK